MICNSIPVGISDIVSTLFRESSPAAVILSLSVVDRETQGSYGNWLHGEELQQLAQFSYAKRHREWLGGRICAKESLRIYLQQHEDAPRPLLHHQSRIASEESGRPYFSQLADGDFSYPELSISHSKDYAAAMSCSTHCGIDIQYPAENLLKVQERFATPAEERLLRDSLSKLTFVEQLSMLWAGKEAVKKMLSPFGMPGFQELTLQTIRPHDTNHAVLYFSHSDSPKKLLPVATTLLTSRYALALCCQTDQTPLHSMTKNDARTP